MTAKERIYLTADRRELVGENDPRAAFLMVGAGQEIPRSIVARFQLTEGTVAGSKPEELPGPSSGQIEQRQTRVPPVPKKRG